MMSVPAFAKGIEQGFEIGFGTLLRFCKPAQLRHTDAYQLLKAAHALLETLVVAIHARLGTVHASLGTVHERLKAIQAPLGAIHARVGTIHAGFGGRLAFCHSLQDGFDLVELLPNGSFHTQSSLTQGKQVAGAKCHLNG